jgi:hypothetical protein
MIDEITKNVDLTLNILANIGACFLLLCTMHLIGTRAYFTPKFISELPFWILGFSVGYLGKELYKSYK